MTREDVFTAIAEVVSDRTDPAKEDVKEESTFRDLGVDSLDTVEILMELEDKLGTEIELDRKISTVGDLVSFIVDKEN